MMIYDLIDMTEWITKEKILQKLKRDYKLILPERKFREMVEQNNESYAQHLTDIFIAHGCKGYKVTTNHDEIRDSAQDYRKRAIDQLTKYHNITRALGENANFSFQIKNGEMIFVEMEGK